MYTFEIKFVLFCSVKMTRGLCPACKYDEGGYVHPYQNEREGFCPSFFCPAPKLDTCATHYRIFEVNVKDRYFGNNEYI